MWVSDFFRDKNFNALLREGRVIIFIVKTKFEKLKISRKTIKSNQLKDEPQLKKFV